MSEDIVKQLVHAGNVMLANPNEVTADQRHAAEKVFLDFQNTKSPFNLCRHLLYSCENDYVLFQTATLLRNAVIREWGFLNINDIESLTSNLFEYICTKRNLKVFVREQISLVLAIISKRKFVFGHDYKKLYMDASLMMRDSDPHVYGVGASLLTALLNEFSNSMKSSDLGLTWEKHLRTKRGFENTDLVKIFEEHLQLLGENVGDLQFLNTLLQISVRILSWNFQLVPVIVSKMFQGVLESMQNPPLRLPSSWSNILSNFEVVQMFFKTHWLVRANQELSHFSLQCLVQLASLNGPLMKNAENRTKYVLSYLQNFLQFLSSGEILDHEMLGIADIFMKLSSEHSHIILTPINRDFEAVRVPFFNKITELTCHLACQAALEEYTSKDDQIYMEAYEHIIEGWSMLFMTASQLKQPLPRDNCIQIFNCYLKCHLSAPDGNKGQNAYEDNEEIDEIEESDRNKFRVQLAIMGCFGRQILDHSVPLLYKLIEERVCRLFGQLQRIMQQSHSMNIADCTIMNMLSEDLHWLVMITGHLLILESKGETALIPQHIMDYSMNQLASGVDINTTLQVLASPAQKVSEIPASEQSSDHIIRLIAAVFRLCEVEKRALEANIGTLLSPEVATTLMWFLENWILTYLLPSEDLYTKMSPTLMAAFGRDKEAGVWTVNFILSKICSNLFKWNSEEGLMDQTISCFYALVKDSARSSAIMQTHEMWNLVTKELGDELFKLQPKAKRGLFKALTIMGMKSRTDNNIFGQIFEPLFNRFQSIMTRQDLAACMTQDETKLFVVHFIEASIGACEGCPISLNNPIASLYLPIAAYLNQLINICHHNFVIYKPILDYFLVIVDTFTSLKYDVQKELRQKYIEMLQLFAKYNLGMLTTEVNAEDEQFEALLTILKILSNLTINDISDIFANRDPNSGEVDGSDLALYGLRIFLPLRLDELFKFPTFCTLYYKLIADIAHVTPMKILSLPMDVLEMILKTIEHGLTTLTSSTMMHCFEVIGDLGLKLFQLDPNLGQRKLLKPFLKTAMNVILFGHLETNRCSTTSAAFYTLICCYEAEYRSFVEEILSQQEDPKYKEQLIQLFSKLTEGQELSVNRRNKIKFRQNFDLYIGEIQGILCIK